MTVLQRLCTWTVHFLYFFLFPPPSSRKHWISRARAQYSALSLSLSLSVHILNEKAHRNSIVRTIRVTEVTFSSYEHRILIIVNFVPRVCMFIWALVERNCTTIYIYTLMNFVYIDIRKGFMQSTITIVYLFLNFNWLLSCSAWLNWLS